MVGMTRTCCDCLFSILYLTAESAGLVTSLELIKFDELDMLCEAKASARSMTRAKTEHKGGLFGSCSLAKRCK